MRKFAAFVVLLLCLPGAGAYAQNDAIFANSYKLEGEKRYDAAAAAMQPLADGGHEFARLRMAWLAYLGGKYNDSINHYNRVLQTNPNSMDGRLGVMLPLMAQQRWQDAAAQGRQVLSLSAMDYTAHVRLMACEEAMKQWAALEQHAQGVALAFASDATALVYLARAKAWQRKAGEAKAVYAQVLERYPSNEEARAFLKNNP